MCIAVMYCCYTLELQSFMNKNRQLADQILEKTQTYRENITPQTPAKLQSLLEYLNKLQG